jgi:hypothetical protein
MNVPAAAQDVQSLLKVIRWLSGILPSPWRCEPHPFRLTEKPREERSAHDVPIVVWLVVIPWNESRPCRPWE